jgi:hypothetical protein
LFFQVKFFFLKKSKHDLTVDIDRFVV